MERISTKKMDTIPLVQCSKGWDNFNTTNPLINSLIFIFLSCCEKGHNNKEFSRENSKLHHESWIVKSNSAMWWIDKHYCCEVFIFSLFSLFRLDFDMYLLWIYIHKYILTEFSGHGFKSHSGQLSIATSKNPSVVNMIYVCIYIYIIYIYIYYIYIYISSTSLPLYKSDQMFVLFL